jgi:hypothetical protein
MGRGWDDELAEKLLPGRDMSREQRELLLMCIRLYLNGLWTTVAPSPERNNTIRVLQGVRGKVLESLEQAALSPLPLSVEEQRLVADLLHALIQDGGNVSELNMPEQRAGLSALKAHVEWWGSV